MSRILHFGPGNFFRAHLAEYTYDAGGWPISVVSLRSAGFRDAWVQNGGSYTLAVQGDEARKIDVISDVLLAPETPQAVLDLIADPSVQIISATVTEKGYDVPNADAPISVFIAYLAHGLSKRTAPVTLLSCDNGSANGDRLAGALKAYCEAAGLSISCAYTCPNSMVDRITPATTEYLRNQTGDVLAVPCEPFKEWVLEDRFSGQKPDWPGLQWVTDVKPHELRKLRMLNGAHSYLAYAGVLKGYEFVHQAIGDPALRRGALALMNEARETLPEPLRSQAAEYADALIKRFENPHLDHALRQIAMDVNQKLPYRAVESWAERRALGMRSPAIVASVRAWIDFCVAERRAGRLIQDPKADALANAETTEDFVSIIARSPDDTKQLTADVETCLA